MYKLDWFEQTIVLVVIHFYLCHRFVINKHSLKRGPSWSWSYDSWIYNYLCIWPLTLWVRILLMARVLDKTLYYKVCYWLVTVRWFSAGIPVSSTNKTHHHDIINWNIVENGFKHHNSLPAPNTESDKKKHFQQYFSNIVAVILWNTHRPVICNWWHYVVSSIHRHEWKSNTQF
jgi:hypothetical protein